MPGGRTAALTVALMCLSLLSACIPLEGSDGGGPAAAGPQRGMGSGADGAGTRAPDPLPVDLYITPDDNGTLGTQMPSQGAIPSRVPDITFSLAQGLHGALKIAPSQTANLQLSISNPSLSDVNATIILWDDSTSVAERTQPLTPTQSNDIWELEIGAGGHEFGAGSVIMLQVFEPDGANLQISYGSSASGYARLTLECENHIPPGDFEAITRNAAGDPTQDFEPNAPENKRVIEFYGSLLDVFGSSDVETVEVSCLNAGLDAVEMELTAGDDGEVSFTYEWAYDAGLAAGNYPFTITATDLSGNAVVNDESSFVFLDYGVYIYTTQSYRDASPGESATYELTVVNTGGKSDTITIDPDIDPDLSGWGATLSVEEIQLGPGSERDVDLTVEVAGDEDLGVKGKVTVTAISGESGRDHQVVTTTTVIGAAGFSFELLGSSSVDVDPGGKAEYGMLLENRGDQAETYEVGIVEAPPEGWGWSLSGGTQMSPGSYYELRKVVLEPDESDELTLTVLAPEYPTVDEATALVRASPANGTQEIDIITTTLIAGTAAEVDIDLEVDEISRTVDAASASGDSIRYKTAKFIVTVKNDGNVESRVFLILEASQDDAKFWDNRFTEDDIPVLPASQKSVTLEITPTDNTLAGLYDFTVTAEAEGDDGWVASSESITVRVAEFHRVSIAPGNSTEEKLRSITGGATFELTLKNTGNTDETARMEVEDEGGWTVEFSDQTPDIAPGESATVEVTAFPPDDIAVGDSFTLTVYAGYGGSGSDAKETDTVELKVTYEGSEGWDLAGFFGEFGIAFLLLIALIVVAVGVRAMMSSGPKGKGRRYDHDEAKYAGEEEDGVEGAGVEEATDTDRKKKGKVRKSSGGGGRTGASTRSREREAKGKGGESESAGVQL